MSERASGYFRALAVDYDGTLTFGPRPTDSVLDALARLRAMGRVVVLVTGRVYSHLLCDFPEVAQHFDSIVAENGATLVRRGRERNLARRVSEQLEISLRATGIPVTRGSVILAMDACHDGVVRATCVRLGLDAQLVRNREALMVLPAGVSKGSGAREALAELGISLHNAIGVGDAENDLSLLEACEVGVAVSNAVESLRAQADLVLQDRERALERFLIEDVTRGLPSVQPKRRRIELGTNGAGAPVTISASRQNLFIDGPTGAGKSYLAGAFAERVVEAGYTICVLDPEGEHAALGQLRGVLTLGGRDPVPPVEEVGRILQHRFSSVVIDLSLREPALKQAYAAELIEQLTIARRSSGLPHWILLEEAHAVPSVALEQALAEGAMCLVTYRPDWLSPGARRAADVSITVEAAGRAILHQGEGLPPQQFNPGPRSVEHTRHRRKYAEGRVPFDRGFTFRDATGWNGAHVASLQELVSELQHAPRASLAHHAARGDFSRWIGDVFRDKRLATSVARAEQSLHWDNPLAFAQTVQDLVALRYAGVDQDAL